MRSRRAASSTSPSSPTPTSSIPFYTGPESNPEDTESIFKTTERLEAARGVISSLTPRVEKVFLVGGRKLGLRPYYSIEHRGWKFIHLNNFLGDTWNKDHEKFDPSKGSLGEEQLNWFEAELAQHTPSFVFIHYPLSIVETTEVKDYGVHALIKRHRDSIQRVVSGHWHRWFEFGRSYGPQHLVMAATRYDPNAYLIVEADTKTVRHELLNIDLVDWNTHYSKPYRAQGPAA